MKKILFKTMIVIIFASIIFSFNNVFGQTIETGIEKNIEYKSSLSDIYSNVGGTKVNDVGGKIIGVVQLICYAAAFIILLIKGVQFMIAAPEAKADIKKSSIHYAIGALILFMTGTIVKIVGTMAMNNIK